MTKRILVIDDNKDFCEMMEELLSNEGYEVQVIPSPILGAGDALSGEFDLITLDLQMPEFQGTELAQLFQEMTLETPVLVISGYLNDSILKQLADAGIKHTLGKPFKSVDLVRAIESAIE